MSIATGAGGCGVVVVLVPEPVDPEEPVEPEDPDDDPDEPEEPDDPDDPEDPDEPEEEPDEPDEDPDEPDELEDPDDPNDPVLGIDVTGGLELVLGTGDGAGADDVVDGTETFGSVLDPVLVVVSGVVGDVVVVAAGGAVVTGGAWATWLWAAVCVGGSVWSSLSAAYDAATAPTTSRPVRPSTADIDRTPGRPPSLPAAVPHARHQSWPGSIVAPQDRHVRSSGAGGASSGDASAGGSGGASGATSGLRSSSFIGLQVCTTRPHGRESRCGPDVTRARPPPAGTFR